MRVLPPFEQKIRGQIRDEMATKPLITVMAIKERMVRGLRPRLRLHLHPQAGQQGAQREIVIEIDRAQIEPRLAFTRENYRMMREELLKIVYWTPEKSKRHQQAARTLRRGCQERRRARRCNPKRGSRSRHVQEAARSACEGNPLRASKVEEYEVCDWCGEEISDPLRTFQRGRARAAGPLNHVQRD